MPGDGGIERGDQRGGACGFGFFGEDGRDEFEIAYGDGVEDERVVLLVKADAIQMAEGFDAGRVIASGGIFRGDNGRRHRRRKGACG